MALFPIREDEVIKLGDALVHGLKENTADFPSPPIAPAELRKALDAALKARDAAAAARAAAEQATEKKDMAFEVLKEKMRRNLRYAENTVAMNDEKLRRLGWGKPKRGRPCRRPGQVRALEVSLQDSESLVLDWKAPNDGGKVVAYRVESRTSPEDLLWNEVLSTTKTNATLEDQTHGIHTEYRVVACNKGGDGEPSNTVLVEQQE